MSPVMEKKIPKVTALLLVLGALGSLVLGVLTVTQDCKYARIGVDIWLSIVYLSACLMIAVEDKVKHTLKRFVVVLVLLSAAVQVGFHIASLIRSIEEDVDPVDPLCVPVNAALIVVASTLLFVGVILLISIRRITEIY